MRRSGLARRFDERSGEVSGQLRRTVCPTSARPLADVSSTPPMAGDSYMLSAILESLADGVIVADEHGKFTVFNDAAEHMLGLGAVDAAPAEWSQRYGVFRPDMTTPYPAEE